MTRPVVHLIGTAGHPNYGDEFIAASWLRTLARVAPDAEVWLDTPRPGQAAVLLEGLHPGLRCVDTLFHACWNAPTDDLAETIAFGERVIGDPGLIPREVSGVLDLERVDLVHIMGGGYINGIWPNHLALVGAARGVARRFGARLAITGAGLMPLAPGSTAALGDALAEFNVVDVRDEPSYAAISHRVPQATLTADDALLSPLPHLRPRDDIRSGTMLCIQSDQLERPLPELANYVVKTLQSWGVDSEPITLVECLPPSDADVLQLLRPHLPKISLLPFSELWRVGLPVAPGQRWISTRFHPHMLAAASGVWGVAVPVSDGYYRTKHESLVRLGSGWTIANDLTRPVDPPEVATSWQSRGLATVRADKAEVAKRVASLLNRR